MKITKITRTLTDGARVYDLAIEVAGQTIELHAITRADADHLAEKIGAAIEQHSCSECVTYGFRDEAAEAMLDNFNWVGSRHHY